MSGGSPSIVPVKREAGWTHYNIGGNNFVVLSRYEVQKLIGIGAYGLVCSAIDTESGTPVAIKKIANAFENLKYTKRTLREIKLLRHFNHDHILGLRDILPPHPSQTSLNSIYIVTDLMDTDLHQIIASKQNLGIRHYKYFIYQILCGLKYIHSANVLHRDLKPSNLLINSDCFLMICDFGMARVAAPTDDDEGNSVMTEYVATRWYRAPEVILSWNHYSKAIDIWSVGCVLAELLLGRPLFPGSDYVNQIDCIANLIGTPSPEHLMSIPNEDARRYVQSLGTKPAIPFGQIIPAADSDAIDLLSRMLTWDASSRITVEEALAHPFVAGHHNEEDEPLCTPFDFDFEGYDLTKEVYQDLIYQEMLAFHPELSSNESGMEGNQQGQQMEVDMQM